MNTTPSIEQRYQRAASLVKGLQDHTLVQNDTLQIHWIDHSDCFWYQRQTLVGGTLNNEYCLVDVQSKAKKAAFDHQALAQALGQSTEKAVDANHLPITDLDFTLSPLTVCFTAFEQRWQFDALNKTCKTVERDGIDTIKGNELRSPDGTKIAFTRNHNLWIKT